MPCCLSSHFKLFNYCSKLDNRLSQYEQYNPDILKKYLTQDLSLEDINSHAFLKRRKPFFII